jgi:hypothetical protein
MDEGNLEGGLRAAEPPSTYYGRSGDMTLDQIRTKFRNFPAANLIAKIVSR